MRATSYGQIDLVDFGDLSETNGASAEILSDSVGFNAQIYQAALPNLSIDNATISEGNAGFRTFTFTVSLSAPAGPGGVTFDIATADGTAQDDNPLAEDADYVPQSLTGQVIPAGSSTYTFNVSVRGDTVVEPNESFFVNVTNVVGANVSGGQGMGTIANDDIPSVPIYTIQAATHSSPFAGTTVRTSGIVTAVDSNGFYLQDPSGDANDATSDGIFVFTSSAPTVSVGDAVAVTGTVTEFVASATSLGVTEIVSPVIVINSTGNSLPAATIIGTGGRAPPTENYEDDNFTSFDPATDALDFYESMEGMRVTIDNPLVVADSNSFGETFVVASGGAGATGINARKGITVSENDFNPERIQIDNDANLSPGYAPNHSQGDELGDVTGIMNYAFSSYEVLVTGPVTVINDVTLGQEITALDGDATHLTVATFNVENLDPTDPQSKFDAIAGQIVNNLSAPDIVGLQEIQDADGTGSGSNLSGQATADKLIAAIVAAGGPTYQYIEVAPATANSTGGEHNGNIRNGYLYNPARVSYVPGSAELVDGSAFSGARRPLAADFTFNGETVTVLNVHLNSRGGSDPLMGDNQPPANGGGSARLTQAQAVRDYIDGLAAGDPELNIVTLGDFNSFYFEAPLQALQAGGAQNNLFLLLPEEERYSYLFDANLHPFDNILVGPNLNLTSEFDAVHLNTEQPAGTAKPTGHDPTLAEILISADDVISSTSGNDVRRSGAGNDLFFLAQGGNDSAFGGDGDDGFYFGAAYTSADAVDGGAGTLDQIGLQGDYGGVTLGSLTGVELVVLLHGGDTRFGAPGTNFHDYNITATDSAVAASQNLILQANTLRVGEDFTFNGSAELDGTFTVYGGLGTDTFTGGSGSAGDGFFFGQGRFGASDVINGGGSAMDQVGFQGDFTITFGATQLTNVEFIVLLSAVDTRFGAGGGTAAYNLTMNNGNVASGQQMIISANNLKAGETLTFNGAAEADGSFRIFSGASNDTISGSQNGDEIYGGGGADVLAGNGGADQFVYIDIAHSTTSVRDTIVDFTPGTDKLNLSAIDANQTIGSSGNDAFNFIGSQAFSGVAGELRLQNTGGGSHVILGDVNGDGVAEFAIQITDGAGGPLTVADILL